MDSVTKAPSQTISVAMASGSRYCISEVFLCEEAQLRRAHALRIAASQNLGGGSTGIGFWGSPQWALGGALALGILEGIANNAAAKKGISQLEEANHALTAAKNDGAFIPVEDIQNIAVPQPELWRGIAKNSALKSYSHSGEHFILARDLEVGPIYLAWEKIESFVPPPIPQIDVAQQMEQFGITFDGKRYFYGTYRHEQLANVISFAKFDR